jgi:hypothetical protein
MSTLPPKADIGRHVDHVRRTSSGSLAIFAAIRLAFVVRSGVSQVPVVL